MGYKNSWIAFHGYSREKVLGFVGGSPKEPRAEWGGVEFLPGEVEFCIAELPNSWIIVYAEEFMYAYEKTMELVSRDSKALGCMFHEGIMYSRAHLYEFGREVWAIEHDGQNAVTDLGVAGELPTVFDEIHKKISKEQADAGPDSNVDYYFDIPIEVAHQISGFEHSKYEYDWGRPVFSEIAIDFTPPQPE